jgi:4-oxalocrotonate tautomerase
MPYINVKVGGSLTPDQKREIARRFSAVLEDVAGKKPSSTYTVFDEVDRTSWAVGGDLLSDGD